MATNLSFRADLLLRKSRWLEAEAKATRCIEVGDAILANNPAAEQTVRPPSDALEIRHRAQARQKKVASAKADWQLRSFLKSCISGIGEGIILGDASAADFASDLPAAEVALAAGWNLSGCPRFLVGRLHAPLAADAAATGPATNQQLASAMRWLERAGSAGALDAETIQRMQTQSPFTELRSRPDFVRLLERFANIPKP